MDNFDEFEFKPITEGLGFHKKTQKPKLDLTDTLQGKTLPSAPPKARDQMVGRPSQFTKLGEEKVPLSGPTPTNQPNVSRGNASRPAAPQKSLQYQMNSATEFIEEPQMTKSAARQWSKENISVALPSIFFDTMVVLGLTGLFSFSTFLIAKVDPLVVVRNIPGDPMTTLGMAILIFSVMQGYLLMARSFFGSTLGEWAFEIEVGTKQQQESVLYPIQILWRSLVTLVTGIVILPLLSIATGKDIGGKLSGVSLYRG